MLIPAKVLSQAIVIVDEIDQSYVEHLFDIERQGDKRYFKYPGAELFKCAQIIGFTGSLSEPAFEIITVDRRDYFKTLRFPNLS